MTSWRRSAPWDTTIEVAQSAVGGALLLVCLLSVGISSSFNALTLLLLCEGLLLIAIATVSFILLVPDHVFGHLSIATTQLLVAFSYAVVGASLLVDSADVPERACHDDALHGRHPSDALRRCAMTHVLLSAAAGLTAFLLALFHATLSAAAANRLLTWHRVFLQSHACTRIVVVRPPLRQVEAARVPAPSADAPAAEAESPVGTSSTETTQYSCSSDGSETATDASGSDSLTAADTSVSEDSLAAASNASLTAVDASASEQPVATQPITDDAEPSSEAAVELAVAECDLCGAASADLDAPPDADAHSR